METESETSVMWPFPPVMRTFWFLRATATGTTGKRGKRDSTWEHKEKERKVRDFKMSRWSRGEKGWEREEMDEKDGFCLSRVSETLPEPKPRLQQQVQPIHLCKEVLLWFPDHPQNIRVWITGQIQAWAARFLPQEAEVPYSGSSAPLSCYRSRINNWLTRNVVHYRVNGNDTQAQTDVGGGTCGEPVKATVGLDLPCLKLTANPFFCTLKSESKRSSITFPVEFSVSPLAVGPQNLTTPLPVFTTTRS